MFGHIADAVGFVASCVGIYLFVEMLITKFKKRKQGNK
jgi:hypothetical protein